MADNETRSNNLEIKKCENPSAEGRRKDIENGIGNLVILLSIGQAHAKPIDNATQAMTPKQREAQGIAFMLSNVDLVMRDAIGSLIDRKEFATILNSIRVGAETNVKPFLDPADQQNVDECLKNLETKYNANYDKFEQKIAAYPESDKATLKATASKYLEIANHLVYDGFSEINNKLLQEVLHNRALRNTALESTEAKLSYLQKLDEIQGLWHPGFSKNDTRNAEIFSQHPEGKDVSATFKTVLEHGLSLSSEQGRQKFIKDYLAHPPQNSATEIFEVIGQSYKADLRKVLQNTKAQELTKWYEQTKHTPIADSIREVCKERNRFVNKSVSWISSIFSTKARNEYNAINELASKIKHSAEQIPNEKRGSNPQQISTSNEVGNTASKSAVVNPNAPTPIHVAQDGSKITQIPVAEHKSKITKKPMPPVAAHESNNTTPPRTPVAADESNNITPRHTPVAPRHGSTTKDKIR